MSTVVALETKPAVLIARYVRLRDQLKADDARYEEFRQKEYVQPMEQIEQTLLAFLNETNTESIRTSNGTAYRQVATSVTTADGAAFRGFVIDNEAWELVDWRPNKTAINELVGDKKPIPPGINRTATYKVNVRRK